MVCSSETIEDNRFTLAFGGATNPECHFHHAAHENAKAVAIRDKPEPDKATNIKSPCRQE
ncbi:MAG: hypothetical protein NTY15_09455 [Planctomycetota bacterium]|nr:hypothetical protein [Planctomycetota bacterium]